MTPEAAGTALIDHAENYHAGWNSSRSEATMLMYDERGKESKRELRTYAIEKVGSVDAGQSLIIYDRAGTGMFTRMSRTEPDGQWLWVPGVRRLKRIKSDGLAASFIGSEFAYEDFRSQYPRKYENRLLQESEVDGQPVWVIERIPKIGDSEYSRLVVHMDQEHFRAIRTDFFDKAGRELKRLTAEKWELRDGRFWHAAATRMENVQTKRASVWATDSITFDAGITKLEQFMR